MSMITIDGIEYDPANFTNDQQALLAQVNNCRAKMQSLRMDYQVAEVAEQQFSAALIASVRPKPEDPEAAPEASSEDPSQNAA